ncbi:energy-coupling factor ABC transporter ATP-binding protein [Thiocapsa imhoffii]|uniref:Energy-coupling factor ABC transporter ATP-binding protein n=1 Tax=Thiocapsa imhoffii TaxID=382777 RepID=A0A9X0WGA4_9GAMM|nr:ABC transporter ATP-binding protein [Thiocapsa imhoffii]MBK1643960.1 energy-coupling factor ABC transporter ATP-binding protein [Thiocapsa imhoffii]
MSHLFELVGIHFAYPGQPDVLRALDLTLDQGERIAITGPNGSGKSTLLRLMVGLLRPQSGLIMAFGEPRRHERDFRLVRQRVGLLFPDPDDQLFCPTVAEDVAFGPLNLGKTRQEALEMVEQTLARLQLSHLRARVTHTLSSGEKRLVSLATVLAMEPAVLLLDEPTNGLDESTEARLIAILAALPQALLVVSHNAQFRHAVTHRQFRLEQGLLHPMAGPAEEDSPSLPRACRSHPDPVP